MFALEINNLTKKYKDNTAVNALNLHVPEGNIYGFLGKNGAGKTTTIKLVLGLANPDSGTISILGKDFSENRLWAFNNIGAMIEIPGFYSNLSAIKNLRLTADVRGIPLKRVHEVVEIVGLKDVINRKVRYLSTGMKQRLGIANALIHSPKILILDEPTNGLDPQGMIDLRSFIKRLANELKITIVMSSHILSEVEQVADYIGIIHKGALIEEFSMKDFAGNRQSHVILEVDKIEEAMQLIKKLDLQYSIENNLIKVFCEKEVNSIIGRELVTDGIAIYNMCSVKNSLEDRFLKAINENI